MTYLQLFALAFAILHSISVLFINKLSLAKRLFLAFWMALFVLGVPMIYSYLPSVAFIAVCLIALSVYVITLFYQESKALKNHLFRKPRQRSKAVDTFWDEETDNQYAGDHTGAVSIVNATGAMAESLGAESQQPSQTQTSQTPVTSQASLATELPETSQTATENLLDGESSLLADMLKKLDQIDNLLSSDDMTAEEASAETERLSESLQAFDQDRTLGDREQETSSLSLEDMFYEKEETPASVQDTASPQSDPSEGYKVEEAAPSPTEVGMVEEQLLLDEIDDIIASHTDLEKEWSSQETAGKSEGTVSPLRPVSERKPVVPETTATTDSDVFTLRPIAEQTIEIIKEKQDEDGLLSVEEQLDKELYFQFLLYESKELLTLGMYQETVDYLKEILIDSYDKVLRREALELLESIKVDLYHPKALGDRTRDYKKLEERKVL